MAMTFHFLVNDNHVSDGWVFGGITTRQAHVLQLNRDPYVVVPQAVPIEKQLRCKIWQLVMCQDVGIALFLKLPSASEQSDIRSESFTITSDNEAIYEEANTHIHPNSYPIPALSFESHCIDVALCRSLWEIGRYVQLHICKPRAVDLPMAQSPEHKRSMTTSYRAMGRAFPEPFVMSDPFDRKQSDRFWARDRRLARQQMGLASNYYHPMMLIYADENKVHGVKVDVSGTLEAAHGALQPFFAMLEVFGPEVNGFWAYQHRSFEVAVGSLAMALLKCNFRSMTLILF